MKRFLITTAIAFATIAPAAAATLDDVMAQLKSMQADNQSIRRDNEQMRKEIASLRSERKQPAAISAVPAVATSATPTSSRDLPRNVSTAMASASVGRNYYKATPATGPYDWSGFYAGVNAGYASGHDTMTVDNVLPNQRTTADGFFGGGQIGYNWQSGAFLLGVEADIQGASIGGAAADFNAGNAGTFASATNNDKLDAFGTVRGRLGYAFDRFLVYGTGGLAAGQVTQEQTFLAQINAPLVIFSGFQRETVIAAGWTAGAGLEYAVRDGWSIKAEYLHLAFDSKRFAALSSTTEMNLDLVRGGVNYHF